MFEVFLWIWAFLIVSDSAILLYNIWKVYGADIRLATKEFPAGTLTTLWRTPSISMLFKLQKNGQITDPRLAYNVRAVVYCRRIALLLLLPIIILPLLALLFGDR